MGSKYCLNCGTLNLLNASICKRCGQQFVTEVIDEQDDIEAYFEPVKIPDESKKRKVGIFVVRLFFHTLFLGVFVVWPLYWLVFDFRPLDIDFDHPPSFWELAIAFYTMVFSPLIVVLTLTSVWRSIDAFINEKH